MSHHSGADSPRVQDDVTEEEFSDRALLDEVLADGPEESDLLQEEFPEDDLPHPVGRRRVRQWVVVLVVLAVTLSAGAVRARYLVHGQVDSAVCLALPGLSLDIRIATRGIVLSQAVGGLLDSLSIDSPSLTITPKGQSNASVTLSDVDVDLGHVSLRKPYQTDAVAASGTVSWQQVATLAAASHSKLKGITLQIRRTGMNAQDPGGIQTSMSVLGLSSEAEVAPSLGAGGSLVLTTTSTRMSRNTLDADIGMGQDGILSYVGLDSPQITIPTKSLPSGLCPTSAIVTSNGLWLGLAGNRVNLGRLRPRDGHSTTIRLAFPSKWHESDEKWRPAGAMRRTPPSLAPQVALAHIAYQCVAYLSADMWHEEPSQS